MITGMRDNASRERVVEVLETVDGVMDVDVNLLRGRATITHDFKCDPGSLTGAVAEAGFGAVLDARSPASGDRPSDRQDRRAGRRVRERET